MKTGLLLVAALGLAGCGEFGKVEQGRTVAYDKSTGQVTLILEAGPRDGAAPGLLPAVTVAAPEDPSEMGPEPAAGGLIVTDYKKHKLVVYDRAAQAFRTYSYTPLEEKRNVAKNPGAPLVDRARKRITIYSTKEQMLVTFAASDEMLALPTDTWKKGDVVRYYYKDPARALRLMNVTKTDLSKSG